jgi:hypothetical protein
LKKPPDDTKRLDYIDVELGCAKVICLWAAMVTATLATAWVIILRKVVTLATDMEPC